jgi:hypothetical protein
MDFNTNYSFKNMFFKSYSFKIPLEQVSHHFLLATVTP